MKITKSQIIWPSIGLVLAIIDFFLFFSTQINLFYFILVIGLIIASTPFILELISQTEKEKEIEEKFLEFSRDLVENVKSGTAISISILNLKSRNYGRLTPHIEKLANQISLGIPLTQAMTTFAKDTQNSVIARSVALISEAEKSGGQIETVLEAVANSVNQIENLQKERKASISNMVVQGYIIFFVFIIIMLILEFKILPMLSSVGNVGTGLEEQLNSAQKKISPDEFAFPMFILIIFQSIFTGLVIGKISEGSIKRGIRHSAILLAITLLVVLGARAFIPSG